MKVQLKLHAPSKCPIGLHKASGESIIGIYGEPDMVYSYGDAAYVHAYCRLCYNPHHRVPVFLESIGPTIASIDVPSGIGSFRLRRTAFPEDWGSVHIDDNWEWRVSPYGVADLVYKPENLSVYSVDVAHSDRPELVPEEVWLLSTANFIAGWR